MYYIIGCEDQILESVSMPPTQDELQAEANFFDCSVYVIRGEHYGMTANPAPDEDEIEEEETP